MTNNCDPRTCPLNQISLNKEEVKWILCMYSLAVYGYNRVPINQSLISLREKLEESLFSIQATTLPD